MGRVGDMSAWQTTGDGLLECGGKGEEEDRGREGRSMVDYDRSMVESTLLKLAPKAWSTRMNLMFPSVAFASVAIFVNPELICDAQPVL